MCSRSKARGVRACVCVASCCFVLLCAIDRHRCHSRSLHISPDVDIAQLLSHAHSSRELEIPDAGLFPGWNGEDPYVWLDAKGRVHAVYHCYVNDEDPVGCHSVLEDLDGDWTKWVSPGDQAACTCLPLVCLPCALLDSARLCSTLLDSASLETHKAHHHPTSTTATLSHPTHPLQDYRNVTFDNGTRVTLGRRERPQVLVSKDGLPVALFSGATIERGNSFGAATFTMGQAVKTALREAVDE